MKKLLSLVLICVMGFGMISCVESEESQSVTELRNAKAEQLKALVNLYNAQAEAAKITAQAEAALKAAEAAYQQAQADYTAEQLAQLKKKFELQLESLIAEYESKLAKYNYDKALYEKQLMDKLAEIEKAAEAELVALYTKYADFSDKLNAANTNLIKNKVNLAKVEAEIVSVKEAAEATIALKKEEIATYEESIAINEAQLAIFKNHAYSNLNADSLSIESGKAYAEWKTADFEYIAKEKKATAAALKAAADARTELNNSISDENISVGIVNNTNYGDVITKVTDDESGNKWFDANGNEQNPVLSVYIDETNLIGWKTKVQETDLEGDIETKTEALEKAEATLKAFQGFKADFEKAETARAALYAYDQAYKNYDQETETVEYAEKQLKQIADNKWVENAEKAVEKATKQLDTLNNKVDLTKFTTEDYDEWDFNFWVMSQDLGNSLAAFRSALLTQEAKLEALEDAKDVLEAAQDAKEALTEEATEAEVEAADLAIENAEKGVADAEKEVKAAQEAVKKAYDKVVYDAEAILENYKENLNNEKDWKARCEKSLATAKENKVALEDAFAAAKAAMATLDELYNDESKFAEFWKENSFSYSFRGTSIDGTTQIGNAWRANFNKAYFLLDANNDNVPDLNMNPDGTVVNGLYIEGAQYQWYADFAAANKNYYLSDDKGKYLVPDYDYMESVYAEKVASAKDALNNSNANLAKASEWKTNWDAKEKELREFVAAKNSEIKDVQALVDAYNEAKEADKKAYDAVLELKGKYTAIRELYVLALGLDTDFTISNSISTLESNIDYWKGLIVAAEEEIAKQEAILASDEIKWENRTQYKEALIAELKANIEKYTAEVELYTKLVEDVKAALDAAMSAADAE